MSGLRWLYLDLNSFFASCEQQERPELRGKPVAVVPMLVDSTAVLAASYEAKAHGIKTGTSVQEARQRCPDITFLIGRHKTYIQYHHAVMAVVESCIPIEQIASIDEAACRLTGSQQQQEKATDIALKIKQCLRREVGECLTASIGLAPNRFLAKVAADMKKPDGLTVLLPSQIPHALYPLSLIDLPGIGPRMQRRMWQSGIYSVEALCALSSLRMRSIWGGVGGARFHAMLHGEDVDDFASTTSSMGHQHVLEPQLRTPEGAYQILRQLLSKAAERMRGKGYYCRELSMHIKLMQHEGYLADHIRFNETNSTAFLLECLQRMMQRMPAHYAPLRVGVTLSDLAPAVHHQLDIFDKPKPENLVKALDALNKKYGRGTVGFGLSKEAQQKAGKDKIAFSRVPSLYET